MLEPSNGNIDRLTDEGSLTLHAQHLQGTARRRKPQRVKFPRTTELPSAFAPSLSEADAHQQANLFRALADHTRLRILDVLNRHGGDVCVFDTGSVLPVRAAYHLSSLTYFT